MGGVAFSCQPTCGKTLRKMTSPASSIRTRPIRADLSAHDGLSHRNPTGGRSEPSGLSRVCINALSGPERRQPRLASAGIPAVLEHLELATQVAQPSQRRQAL